MKRFSICGWNGCKQDERFIWSHLFICSGVELQKECSRRQKKQTMAAWPRVFQRQKAGGKVQPKAESKEMCPCNFPPTGCWDTEREVCSLLKKQYVRSCQLFTGETCHWLVCWSQGEGGDSEFCPKDQPEHLLWITDPVLDAVRRYRSIFIWR